MDHNRDLDSMRRRSSGSSDNDENDSATAAFILPSESPVSSQPELAARNHSYLPGTSHPLMTVSMLEARRRQCQISLETSLINESRGSLDIHESQVRGFAGQCIEIPILLLSGVVAFPGMTLPIRLNHHCWVQYLGQRIDKFRRLKSNQEITIGVVTQGKDIANGGSRLVVTSNVSLQRQRNSWMRTSIDRRRSAAIRNVLDHLQVEGILFENEDNHSDEHEDIEDQENDQADTHSAAATLHQRSTTSNSIDPLVGRIGTFATIINTHESTNLDSSGLWHQPTDQDSLAVTALCTGRFRILNAIKNDEDFGQGHGHLNHLNQYMSKVRVFQVQRLWDEELPLPPLVPPGSLVPQCHHDQIINNLASVSSIPKIVWAKNWPWELVHVIQTILDRIIGLKDLNNTEKQEPTSFSFWIASNLPLRQDEKLQLLELESTLERLKHLRSKLVQLEKKQTCISCNTCRTNIAVTSNVFTVGGAEGTAGAYVNEYGVIHQTVTVKEVNEYNLLYTGRPETHDSWFPGYSWTITHCRYCFSHLGWKFCSVNNFQSYADDRPERFWGLSGASVTMG